MPIHHTLVRLERANLDETGAEVADNAVLTTTWKVDILDRPLRQTDEVSQAESVATEYGYDANRNLTLVRYGDATSGAQPHDTLTVTYDERNLPYRRIRADGHASHRSST